MSSCFITKPNSLESMMITAASLDILLSVQLTHQNDGYGNLRQVPTGSCQYWFRHSQNSNWDDGTQYPELAVYLQSHQFAQKVHETYHWSVTSMTQQHTAQQPNVQIFPPSGQFEYRVMELTAQSLVRHIRHTTNGCFADSELPHLVIQVYTARNVNVTNPFMGSPVSCSPKIVYTVFSVRKQTLLKHIHRSQCSRSIRRPFPQGHARLDLTAAPTSSTDTARNTVTLEIANYERLLKLASQHPLWNTNDSTLNNTVLSTDLPATKQNCAVTGPLNAGAGSLAQAEAVQSDTETASTLTKKGGYDTRAAVVCNEASSQDYIFIKREGNEEDDDTYSESLAQADHFMKQEIKQEEREEEDE